MTNRNKTTSPPLMKAKKSIRFILLPFCVLSIVYFIELWITNVMITTTTTNNIGKESKFAIALNHKLQAKQFSQEQELHPDFPREPQPRPPLHSLVQDWNVTGDVSWLLNLAIIGFPKTGTSTLMKYLHMSSNRIQMFEEERCEMEYNQHVPLITRLYNELPRGDYIRGIKCPRDLEVPIALRNYQAYFPNTDYMIGVRHPILWFESFYNFRVHNLFDMPPAETLIGRCTRKKQGVCTFRSNFQLFLANLGKTNITNNIKERSLIPKEYQKAIKPIPLQGRIFLWDISQLIQNDNNPREQQQQQLKDPNHLKYGSLLQQQQQQHQQTHLQHNHTQFLEDLRIFLHIPNPLPKMIWIKPGYDHSKISNRNHTDLVQTIHKKKINICDSQYNELRSVLLEQGKLASQWISGYFLQSPSVFVSQKEYFINVILKSWEYDPCETTT